MRLRYLTTYDENGIDSPRTLQSWNEEFEYWEDVEDIRVNEKDEKVHGSPDDMPTKEECEQQELFERKEQHEIDEHYRKRYYERKGWKFTPRKFESE